MLKGSPVIWEHLTNNKKWEIEDRISNSSCGTMMLQLSSTKSVYRWAAAVALTKLDYVAVAAFSTNIKNEQLFPEEINILYDSKCNVCKLEMDMLARRDARLHGSRRRIKLTDIESDKFDPNDPVNGGVSYVKGMSAINAVYQDGRVIEGPQVFVKAYELVGLGWLFKFTEWPVFKTVVEAGYNVFAKYRTNITRGSSLDDLILAYEEKKESEQAVCTSSSCTTKR